MQQLLLCKKNTIILCLIVYPFLIKGQLRMSLNKDDHDDKPFHFDLVVGVNRSHFSITHHPLFMQRDTMLNIESINNSGLNLAILFNKRLGEHFNFRTTLVDLTFKQRTFEYNLKYPDRVDGEDSTTAKSVESIYLTFPVQVKFTSDRIDNFKVYMLAGIKAEYDLAANAGAKKAENLIKLKRWDYGIEAGIGFHFYLPYIVLMPELKIGWGLANLHSRDVTLKFSNVIDKINSRTITFSLIIE